MAEVSTGLTQKNAITCGHISMARAPGHLPRRYIADSLQALLGPTIASQVTLRQVRDASSLGAAVLAAAAVRGQAG